MFSTRYQRVTHSLSTDKCVYNPWRSLQMSRLSPKIANFVETLATASKAKAFLGREFLGWLWYSAEKNTDGIDLTIDGELLKTKLWIEDRLVLEGSIPMTHSSTLKGGDPAHSREAAEALGAGKTVKELRLGMEIDGVGPYCVTLSCDGISQNGLAPKSLALPIDSDDGEGEDIDRPLEQRIYHMERFNHVLDGLFKVFIEQRTSLRWETDGMNVLKNWVKEKRASADATPVH